jgi:hypothetical protein
MPGAVLFGSAAAVAAQALRRALQARTGIQPLNGHAAGGTSAVSMALAHQKEMPATGATTATAAATTTDPTGDGTGSLTVILSGRRSELPLAALQYRQGRELASLMADFDPVAGLTA